MFKNDNWTDRIDYLAYMRNVAMEPLFSNSIGKFDKLFFMNDVVFCAEDAVKLISVEGVDGMGALDWKFSHYYYRWPINLLYKMVEKLTIYDTWVMRDLSKICFITLPTFL